MLRYMSSTPGSSNDQEKPLAECRSSWAGFSWNVAMSPGFAATRAPAKTKCKREQRLADPGRPGQQGRGAPPVAIGEHRVQRRDAGGHAFLGTCQ